MSYELYLYLPIALFYLALLALALWGAWLGWTRSKSPTARGFVVAMSLLWAGFTLTGAAGTYREIQRVGLEGLMSGQLETPLTGSYRSCVLCYEGPAGRVYVVAASRIEDANYQLSEPKPARYSLRFKGGTVYADGRALEPGCRTGEAAPGTQFVVPRATGFRLEVGDAASCD
ncbi:hypothetical protein [Oceanithermus desulfurans]|nr:hypothetical protein [Oceanithermus desulfurans]MBB6029246.1 hypothetical protein [Oceanithermus desulfurans]